MNLNLLTLVPTCIVKAFKLLQLHYCPYKTSLYCGLKASLEKVGFMVQWLTIKTNFMKQLILLFILY